MLCLWFFRGSCVSAVTVTLMVLSSALALVRDIHSCFMLQMKCECGFSHGAQQVRYVERHIYNRREFLRFHSDVGEFQALTELGRLEAEAWNKQKDKLEDRRAAVDTFCRYNYLAFESFALQRQIVPQVTVYPAKTQPLQHHNLLVCAVSGFYPGSIQVQWFRNGEEEEAGVVSTGLIRNGDWTFQTLVMLETIPESGEVYSCHVEHLSVSSPIIVEWKAQSASAQTKMLSGVGGLVLGLLFQGLGLLIYFRSQKGEDLIMATLDFS
ncbi:HLA class II histocompatibility antigen, DRB1 beta chain-like [Ochotona princeps]|uniref:HLA class II histocompatibility antigen, DRB1 beta chain-like n=1 Tax=Ochotona princeps TaxID=9978 RepID=UPI002714A333|nr:HLA class II histocompatibility antigen, DRB1 beta chain-like [Ochotona princeps]